MNDTVLRNYRPADREWLVERHQTLYAAEEGFDDSFGPLVQSILLAFEADHDPVRERGWIVERGGERLGSIFCVRLNDSTAKLRLFLLVPEARGAGLGRKLLQTCLQFARDAGYTRMELWTHESHNAACALYDKFGFEITRRDAVTSFGVDMVELTYARDL